METNLQKLREQRGLSHEDLAKETGVAAEKLAGAEQGEYDPATEELYDLAIFFETGTGDLLDSEELAVTTQLDYPENMAYDGFWGHVGILLPGHDHTMWYPVSSLASDGIVDDLQSYEKGFIVIRTLNNRVLFVNPMQVKKIMLNDDSADAPPDFEEIADYMAPVYYEALRERYLESTGAGSAPYSVSARKQLDALIKNEGIDEDKLEDILLNTFIYYGDGISEKYHADTRHLSNIQALGYNVDIPLIAMPERSDVFQCWYPGWGIALIDTPLLEVEEAQRKQRAARNAGEEKEKPAKEVKTGRSTGTGKSRKGLAPR